MKISTHRIIIVWLIAIIITCITLILYPYIPGIYFNAKHQLIRQKTNQIESINDIKHPSGHRLVIPAIDVDSAIIEGDEVAVLDNQEGVWLQAGHVGTTSVVIAGHRFKYLPPNTTTFYNLNKLKNGDTLAIYWDGSKYLYAVDSVFEVSKDDISILNPTSDRALMIYTCSDETLLKRIVVKAIPN